MQEVVIVHLLLKGLGSHVGGHVGVIFQWQYLSHFEDEPPLRLSPSSQCSPGSTNPSPHRGGVLSHNVQLAVQLLP